MHKSGDTLATLNLGYWLEQMKATIAIAAHLAEPVDEPPIFEYQVFLPAVFFNSVRSPALRWRLQSPGRMKPAG